jgi:hypothetical protein
MAGVNVNAAVQLREGLDLVPWSDVPESALKRRFDVASASCRAARDDFYRFTVKPTLALVHRDVGRKVLFASHDEANPGPESGLEEAKARWQLADDIVRCITADKVWPVAVLGTWSRMEDPFANRLTGDALQYSNLLFHMSLMRPAAEALNAERCVMLFSGFAKLQTADRDVLRIALDRLALALRESGVVDKAIDLAIGLEAMLLHQMGKTDRGELKYRASMRAATFLGGSRETRMETFNLLKAAYDLRSAAVHTGSLAEKKISGMSPA